MTKPGPKSVVVWQDVIGILKNLELLQGGGLDVIPVSPRPHRFFHTHTFTPRPEWLPIKAYTEPHYAPWFKADAVALSAVEAFGIDADFYWFIESDVKADPSTWKRLFDAAQGVQLDCLHLAKRVGRDKSTFRFWADPGTPPEAQSHFIMAVYRLSRKAVETSIAKAVEMRNTFSEVAVPWVMEQNGLSMGDINQLGKFYNKLSMGTKPNQIIQQNGLLNHPVKT